MKAYYQGAGADTRERVGEPCRRCHPRAVPDVAFEVDNEYHSSPAASQRRLVLAWPSVLQATDMDGYLYPAYTLSIPCVGV